MKYSHTLNFLITTQLSIIACADENLLRDFLIYLSALHQKIYDKALPECEFEEAMRFNFLNSELTMIKGLNCTISGRDIPEKLIVLMEHANTKNIFVPLQCEEYAKLRSIYFHLSDDLKSEIEIFVLRLHEIGAKLECELGLLAGQYMLYDYDSSKGQLREKD